MSDEVEPQRRKDAKKASPRDDRQLCVAIWCRNAFGVEHAISLPQRGIRLLEEAIEAYQAVDGDIEMAHRLVDFVFSRPKGAIGQELGGIGITLLALAAAANLSAEAEEVREWDRITAKPASYFTARNQAKNAAGFNYSTETFAPLRLGGSTSDPATTDTHVQELIDAVAHQTEKRTAAEAEVERLTALLNTPIIDDFLEGVRVEAGHQVERWGEAHDRSKSAENWFWLVGYLGGKALRAHVEGDRDKALHHTISSAAALLQWHQAIAGDSGAGVGADDDLRPEAKNG